MKLSTLINKDKARSLTVHIHQHYTVVESFFFAQAKPSLKVYGKLEIDVELKPANLENVKHLGIKQYRTFTHLRFYANVYNYATHISEFKN